MTAAQCWQQLNVGAALMTASPSPSDSPCNALEKKFYNNGASDQQNRKQCNENRYQHIKSQNNEYQDLSRTQGIQEQ